MTPTPRSVEINVTEACIKDGIPKSGSNCPIALALIDAGFSNPYVSRDRSYTNDAEWLFPPNACDFIKAFDVGAPVAPFTFTMEEML